MCNGNFARLPRKVHVLWRAIRNFTNPPAQTQNNNNNNNNASNAIDTNDPNHIRIHNARMADAHRRAQQKKEDKKILEDLGRLGFNELPKSLSKAPKVRGTMVKMFQKLKAARNQRNIECQNAQNNKHKIQSQQKDICALQAKNRRLTRILKEKNEKLKQCNEQIKELKDMVQHKESQLAEFVETVGSVPPRKKPRINPDFNVE